MKNQKFKISGSSIHLIKLLKAAGLCAMGSDAKYLVGNGKVKVNGVTDLRLRAKIKPGDRIELQDVLVEVE